MMGMSVSPSSLSRAVCWFSVNVTSGLFVERTKTTGGGATTLYVPLHVLDVDDAIRMAQAFEAALSLLWAAYGHEMGERLLDCNCVNIDTESNTTDSFDLDLIF